MLADKDAIATIAVKDLNSARKFYEGALGFKQSDGGGGSSDQAILYDSGRSRLMVYQSQYAGTNRATAVTWDVGNELDGIIQTLKSKGVRFEHYDMPGMERKGDVHLAGPMRNAWLKDPDGNILALVSAQGGRA